MGDAEAGIDDEKPNSLRKQMFMNLLICVVLISPAAVLATSGFGDQVRCAKTSKICYDLCYTTYRDVTRRFQSEMKGELECQQNCQDDVDECTAKSNSLMLGAVFLVLGVACGVLLNSVLPWMIGGYGSDDSLVEVRRARALYAEPIFTEDETRASEAARRKGWWEAEHVPSTLVEVNCQTCTLKVTLDARWLKAQMSGLKSAICPKCRSIVAGVT
ncbi:unnamed protein product [Polarella glacialis]|uniref:Uncharacterized protein n=2 Tax=Polarella glacialis TaxID=89957 RepID=A0A813DIH4_POLGL|nr:unnamed protein product [Polarella glacialis]|mmetsp:Transcript_19719/g.31479  ORF Transcript_19719/g.31479 Transcript_19719/m.31479 type:complete len:216 (-) Transcript_19719:86-733(-)